MSYANSRRRALDPEQPHSHRWSHVRSCAVRVAEKYGVHRDAICARVRAMTGVDVTATASQRVSDDQEQIEAALAALDELRCSGL